MNRPFGTNRAGSVVRTILLVLRSCFWSAQRTLLAAGSGVAVTLATTGCQLVVNPFTDDLASQQAVTTPSVEGVRLAKRETPVDLRRSYENMLVRAEEGTVTYGPLYFVDPLESRGDKDRRFAWTAKEYLLFFHGQAVFLLHGISWPLSIVAAPPWTVMSSDRRPSWMPLGYIPSGRIDGNGPAGTEPPEPRALARADVRAG